MVIVLSPQAHVEGAEGSVRLGHLGFELLVFSPALTSASRASAALRCGVSDAPRCPPDLVQTSSLVKWSPLPAGSKLLLQPGVSAPCFHVPCISDTDLATLQPMSLFFFSSTISQKITHSHLPNWRSPVHFLKFNLSRTWRVSLTSLWTPLILG